ncbi:hypothetical protein [Dactylococcopsis salina]|uniref:Uncharacterized protein n=1 Tax=Dactylococcopsis salina (strain PCC 8305) TaxID=13035 RepID=K9YY11_DACS8|nr:hypothetical protein [Dactylococcopsis salina]AFZ51799.1 hypothetical protein Dacsa_3289 [Dactylococcopsis salina PCC 8305]
MLHIVGFALPTLPSTLSPPTPQVWQGCFILGVKIESDRLKPLRGGAIAPISSNLAFS